jgi:glycosyltransferase involved in cell wall biosynthesis
LRALASDLGIADRVTFHGRIPLDAVPAVLAGADIALAPTRLDRFTVLTVSGKVYEAAAMGVPVVASALPTVEHDFPDGAVSTYPSGDVEAMAGAIIRLVDDPAARMGSVAAASAIVRELAWETVSRDYVALIDGLAADRPRR